MAIGQERRITVFELSILIFIIVPGVVSARYFGRDYGILGYLFGFLGGAFAPFASIFVFGFIYDFLFVGVPRFPACQKNNCKGKKGYHYMRLDTGEYFWQCRCGDRYVKEGRKLYLGTSLEKRKYMNWVPFRGWHKEA